MTKKHWIYIKRGLSEDPKHRAAMGECVWLYMHIIDRADWETGIAFEWKDKEEAADMSMPVDTLRRQRQKLQELDYIRSEQRQHSQDIYIMEWKNPRDYGSETKNPRNEGSHEQPPLENVQGSNEGSNQVQAQIPTPTYNSKSKSKSDKPYDRKKGIQEAKERKAKQQAAKADGLGAWLKLQDPEKVAEYEATQQLWNRLESALAINVTANQRDREDWKNVIAYLLGNDQQGKTIEKYAEWAKEHPYDAPTKKQLANQPWMIQNTFPAAFEGIEEMDEHSQRASRLELLNRE